MRDLVSIALLLLIIPVAITAQKTSEPNTESVIVSSKTQRLEIQLKTLYERLLQAISEKDVETYKQMTTDKYVFTWGNRHQVLNKEQRVEIIRAESETKEVFSITSARFSIYKNSAIGNFEVAEKSVSQNEEYNYLNKTTVVFIKTKKNGWKIAGGHSSTFNN